jgi:hypothetical protein
MTQFAYARSCCSTWRIRATGYVQGEPVNVTIGSQLFPALAELLATMRNNVPKVVRLTRMGLMDRS